jgi:hypothetical protein
MRDEFKIIVFVSIVILFMIPITFYYLGTLGGVDFSTMSTDLVEIGVFMLVLFIALMALFKYLGRR